MVLFAARRQHVGLWRETLRARALPRPHRRRDRQEDEQVRRQRHRPVGCPQHARRGRPALVDVLAGFTVDVDAREPRRDRLLDARDPRDALEYVQLLYDLRVAEQVRSDRRGHSRRQERSAIDRWILSRMESVTETVTAALDGYEPLGGTDALIELVDDLSNWYVRRSRRRFWRTDPTAPRSDSLAAQATLLEVLQRVTLLMAPFCPLPHRAPLPGPISRERRRLGAPRRLATKRTCERIDDRPRSIDGRCAATHLARARGARAEAGVKVRQPLARALVFLPIGIAAAARGHR